MKSASYVDASSRGMNAVGPTVANAFMYKGDSVDEYH